VYSDADTFGPNGKTLARGQFEKGTFSIVAPDGTQSFTVDSSIYDPDLYFGGVTFNSSDPQFFTPGAELVISGEMMFWLHTEAGSAVTVKVNLTEFTATDNEDLVFVDQALGTTLIASLNATGTLSYKVINTTPVDPNNPDANPTIVLDYAYLSVDSVRIVTPDGGASAILLGIGVASLGAVRFGRKTRNPLV
jgi:hypothetical protein